MQSHNSFETQEMMPVKTECKKLWINDHLAILGDSGFTHIVFTIGKCD